MSNLATMKERIARELARGSSLTTEIGEAINTAIADYKKHRFRFNETLPGTPVTFTTVAGQPYYTANGQTIFKVDYLHVVVGGTIHELNRLQPRDVRLLNEASGTYQGQPTGFAIEGETIMLTPVPDQVYTATIAGIFSYPAPGSDAETGNRWMTDGEYLIRSRAKYEIATHVTRNKEMARMMSPHEPLDGQDPGAAYAEFTRLMRERNQLLATGKVRATLF